MKAELRRIVDEVAHLDVSADQLGDADDLYAAGLSSLTTIQLMLAIEKKFNIEIPDRLLNRYLFQSIDSLAEAVAHLQRHVQSA